MSKRTKYRKRDHRPDDKRLPKSWRFCLAPVAALLVEAQCLPHIIDFIRYPNPTNTFQVFLGTIIAIGAAAMVLLYG